MQIGVRVSDAAYLDRVQECLPPGREPAWSPFVFNLYSFKIGGSRPDGRVRAFHLVYYNLRQIVRTQDLDHAFDALESHLQIHVATNAVNRLVLHAGVVGWRGRAIVLPGYSFRGKSTLVAELLRRGATYYSDEYAVLDADGLVHPYARRLSLRSPGRMIGARYAAADFGAETGSMPLPVGVVAFLKYRPAGRWAPRRLSAGQAVWEMLDYGMNTRRHPEAALLALQRATAKASCWKGYRGEAAEAADRLLQLAEEYPLTAAAGSFARAA